MAIPYGIGVQWNRNIFRALVPSGIARNKITHNSVAIKCTVVASRWARLIGSNHSYPLLHCHPGRNHRCGLGLLPNFQRASFAPPPEEIQLKENMTSSCQRQSRGPAYWPVISTKPLIDPIGIRRREICGLNVGDLDVNRCIIVVQRSRTKRSKLKAAKAGLRNGVIKKRIFSLSPSLTEQLRPFVVGRREDEPLFLTPDRLTKSGKRLGGGVRLEPHNFVKRALNAHVDFAAHSARLKSCPFAICPAPRVFPQPEIFLRPVESGGTYSELKNAGQVGFSGLQLLRL